MKAEKLNRFHPCIGAVVLVLVFVRHSRSGFRRDEHGIRLGDS
jgi:hypothetical protein